MSPRSTTCSAGQPKLPRELDDRGLGSFVVPAHEHVVLAGHLGGIHHDFAVHCVQRLHHPCVGECALDLLAEAVEARDEQAGRHAPRVVERIRDVDEHLLGEVLRARRADRLDHDAGGEVTEDRHRGLRGLAEDLRGGRVEGRLEAPDVPPAMFEESPTTSAMTLRASFTDWSVQGISCFASLSYFSAPAVRM